MKIIIAVILVIFFVIIATVRSTLKSRERKQQIQNRNLLQTVTKFERGTYSERNLVLKLLKNGIPSQTIFHDLYLRKSNGNFSQIDLVVVTTAGIIVFEVKDYSGWIFGKGFQEQWTQVLAFGKQKYRFYNPIMQNNKHIVDLRNSRRQFANIPFYSVIVFDGDCELKDISFVPDGTFVVRTERVLEVIRIIQTNESAPYTDKYEVIRVLQEAVENGANRETELRHKETVIDLLGKHRVFD